MTPCEEKGWKEGDRFIAQDTTRRCFKPGEEIYLLGDDGTHCPKFSNGYETWYLNFTDVAPVGRGSEGRKEPEEEILPIIEDSEGNLYVEVPAQPETSLADKLEQALATLSAGQKEVDRLQAKYREAYPLINGIVLLQEDMSDPKNWREGDIVECIDSEETGEPDYFTEGEHYLLFKKDSSSAYKYIDNQGDDMWAFNEAFRFVSHPQ